jgi:hypothetical protein
VRIFCVRDKVRPTAPTEGGAEARASVGSGLQAFAQFAADYVGGGEQDDERENQRHDLAVFEEAHGEADFVANSAGADETKDGGSAHATFEGIESVSRYVGKRLGPDAAQENLHAGAAGGLQSFERARVDVGKCVGVDAAKNSGVGDRQREGAGKRTQADGGDEEQRPDQIRNGAQESEEGENCAAGAGTNERAETTIFRARQDSASPEYGRGESAQGNRDDHRKNRSGDGRGKSREHGAEYDPQEGRGKVRREESPY